MTPGSHRRICCNHNRNGSHARRPRGETRPRDEPRQPHNETSKRMMTSTDVCELHRRFRALGVEVWIDGGWGVDALLERQTRPHDDLDIVIQQKDVPKLRRLLEAEGYRDVPRDDTSPWNFVLGDDQGREVDIHAVVFDSMGNGLYGSVEKGVMYPAGSLHGTGLIGGEIVRCIAPEWMIRFHSGYVLKEKDIRDVTALCEKFGIDNPLAK
jgi:lincosamide nucleotidyltransferase A/C/D/E